MKNMFKRLIACISAIAVMSSSLPMFEIAALTENDVNANESEQTTVSDDTLEGDTENGENNENEENSGDKENTGDEENVPDIPDDVSEGITREQWIHELVTVFEMSVEDDTSIEYYFTDISSSSYADDIDLAANFGLFEAEGENFDPSGYVTREFAAHTANYCIGYLNDGTEIEIKDIDDIYYEDDVIASVQKGWFELSDGNFEPERKITLSESEKILADAKTSVSDIVIDSNAENIFSYNDSVIILEDTASAVYADGTVTISGTQKTIRPGNVFAVKVNGIESTYKANKVSKNSDGDIVVSVDETSFIENVGLIDIQGIGDVDYENIVTYNTIPVQGAVLPSTAKLYDLYKADVSSKTIPINKSFDLDGIKVELKGSISNIKPEYKLQRNANGEIQSFYLNTTADTDLTVSIGDKFTGTKSKEVKIASAPIFCGGVFNVTVDFTVTVSASSNITLSYKYGISGGASYNKGSGWRTTRNFQKKAFTLDANAEQSIALKARLAASVGPERIGEIYIMAGERGLVQAKVQPDGTQCGTLKAYVFAEFGAKLDLFGLVKFDESYKFINEQNSPVKLYKHWENDVPVAKCKFEDGSGTSSKPKKAKTYVKYADYGTEYIDIITISNSADSGSEMPVTKWDEDKTLDKDVVINGDLIVDAGLNLNGHKLTVTGSFTISENGYLRMTSKTSELNIGGDFATESSKHCAKEVYANGWSSRYNYFTDGLIVIGKNFYQKYATVNNFSLEGTQLKFEGDKEHIISSLYNTNIEFEAEGTLNFQGIFKSITINSDINMKDNMDSCERIYVSGYKLNVEGDFGCGATVYLSEGKTVESEFNVSGNFNSGRIDAECGKITIQGDSEFNDWWRFYGKTELFINGNCTVNAGIYLYGKADVNGDFLIGENGYLQMTSGTSELNIGGDFITESSKGIAKDGNYNYFGYGLITIGGNFYQKHASIKNFSLNGTELIFTGTGIHTLSSYNKSISPSFTLAKGAKAAFTGNMYGIENIEKSTLTVSDKNVVFAVGNIIIPITEGSTKIEFPNTSASCTVKVTEMDGVDISEDCTHVYEDGKCVICKTECTHTYEKGKCTICGTECKHTYKEGKCVICGMVCVHVYGEAKYTWSEDNTKCTATRVCANDSTHIETETAEAKITTTPATCEKAGEKVYTVVFKNEAFKEQSKTETLKALGHKYGEVKYTWSEDSTKCTATRVCANDSTHVETETAEAKVNVIPATCEKAGEKVYTAVFKNEAFKEQSKTETLKALGHKYGEVKYTFAEDNTKCTATRVCANDSTHVEIETAEVKVAVTPATCEKSGEKVYTAVFKNEAFKEQNKTEILEALVHKLNKSEAKPATVNENGNKEYWSCENCKKIFADSEGKTETTLEDVMISKLPEISGDVNMDGKVNSADLLIMKKFIILNATLDEEKSNADINKNGKIDVFDFIRLKQIIIKAS